MVLWWRSLVFRQYIKNSHKFGMKLCMLNVNNSPWMHLTISCMSLCISAWWTSKRLQAQSLRYRRKMRKWNTDVEDKRDVRYSRSQYENGLVEVANRRGRTKVKPQQIIQYNNFDIFWFFIDLFDLLIEILIFLIYW